MSIFSRFRSRRSADDPDQPHSLIRDQYDDPKLAEIQRNAAEDIEAVEQNDKYFDPDSPANEDAG
jgi:hypothetical protein